MFNINDYEFNNKTYSVDIGGENMTFHCHHYLTILQKTLYDAEYIDAFMMMASCSADSVYNQLSNLCDGLSIEESKILAQDIYKIFGNGLIDLTSMDENGCEIKTTKSILSKTWIIQFEKSDKPVDPYTTGFIAAAYAVIYKKNLKDLNISQTTEMASGDKFNTHIIKIDKPNITIYPKKTKIEYTTIEKPKSKWEHAQLITDTFANAHKNFVGNEEGFIYGFGVYIVNTQVDYINRIQFEFMHAVKEVAGEYGITLASELLMQAGYACGFFTMGGIMTSPEWEGAVKPYLKTKEDWIYAIIALTNNMGWGYQYIAELSKDKMVYRCYDSFEDLSYISMYGKSEEFTHWANSGGWSSIMPIIYHSDLVETGKLDIFGMYEEVRKSKYGYRIKRTKGISCGDDYIEMEVYK